MTDKRNGEGATPNGTQTGTPSLRGAGDEADFVAGVPPVLDDGAFLALMESSFAASKADAGRRADGTSRDSGGARTDDDALRERVWEKLQARITSEGGRKDPIPPARTKARWVGAMAGLVGLVGLAAAALLFVRLGGGPEAVDPMVPGGLKGAGEALPTTLEARWDPGRKAYTFHASAVPARTSAGLVLFAPEGGTPRVIARGELGPRGSAGPRTLEESGSPVTWTPGAEERVGRICLFTAEGEGGLASLEAVAVDVFDRHPADLCQNVRVP